MPNISIGENAEDWWSDVDADDDDDEEEEEEEEGEDTKGIVLLCEILYELLDRE